MRLDDDLLAAAKQKAAADRTTLTALIEDSLRQTLEGEMSTEEILALALSRGSGEDLRVVGRASHGKHL